MYLLYRDGLLSGDIKKLLAHSQLPPKDGEVVYNLHLLGSRIEKPLKDTKSTEPPLFTRKPPTQQGADDTSLSRFEPSLKLMLQEHFRGTVDNSVFPSTKPPLDDEGGMGQENVSQSSLRSAKPTWARTRPSAAEPRQRVVVFMAGGATYSEARSCYEISESCAKDVYLVTSHMLTPGLFLRQVGDLNADRKRLDLPSERPKPKAPAHLFEKEQPQPTPASTPGMAAGPPPPSGGLATTTMSSRNESPARMPPNGPAGATGQPQPQPHPHPQQAGSRPGKPPKKDKDKDEKKKRNFFR